MKKIVGILFFLMVFQCANAQVLLNLQIPFNGVYIKSQLWNFSIINPGNENLTIKIEMAFLDATNGTQIFSATTRIFTISQQVTMLQATDLTPIVYNVVNNTYNVDTNPEGFLPVGNFEVCFAIMQVNTETTEKITEQCEYLTIEPISPPLLITPPDEEAIDQSRPFFTWVPPSPVTNFSNLTYDWVLVEVTGNQTSADAIQQNFPVHSVQGLATNSILYPANLPELDTSKLYAWQVAANSSNNAVAKSEIWTFKTRLYGLDTLFANTDAFYSPVKKYEDASYVTTTGILRFEYLNELNDSIVSINFYDLSNTHRIPLNQQTIKLKVRFGQNFLKMDFGSQNGVTDKHIYQLELINKKNEKWYLKFEYREPNN